MYPLKFIPREKGLCTCCSNLKKKILIFQVEDSPKPNKDLSNTKYGFIQFEKETSAANAIQSMNGKKMNAEDEQEVCWFL